MVKIVLFCVHITKGIPYEKINLFCIVRGYRISGMRI